VQQGKEQSHYFHSEYSETGFSDYVPIKHLLYRNLIPRKVDKVARKITAGIRIQEKEESNRYIPETKTKTNRYKPETKTKTECIPKPNANPNPKPNQNQNQPIQPNAFQNQMQIQIQN
jgi:hypothetical protein